jgi:ferredoxin
LDTLSEISIAKRSAVKVIVDYDLCQSHGECQAVAPEVFELDDNDELQVLIEEPDESLRDKVEQAAAVCPVMAITIEG